ncbi:DUF1156 domain-containing protein [Desulforamulus hydrothermalis]|uniref:DUF1156 domain-containing protein n=1 Tax=Desulforamulus hydrothermalis Lam5 = DSM 18033 TaxID=1121428 RepID=K8E0Y9_9FIRM|nr:DUF1156 domain-containing protein [Desulforamulus hydrothermalis]CCO09329.1 conserved hypothetical protein [Desulforamulus hydrothermalis Lam5 = DSM 18033]SHH04039.1 putative DNA methylase [Desulforamulus hydrothermalis Lam5 = DSM 18033]
MEYKKKLIEVALPLEAINDASAYDKMPGIGPHPKGIHHWWARLPLPCARAILFASIVDDPSSDPNFLEKTEEEQNQERERLFDIIRSLVQKKIHNNPEVFEVAFKEIERCCGQEIPIILDPFSGGGSIPLEAQRLGLKSYASDLNPVAVLLNKAQIEIVPMFESYPPVNPKARESIGYNIKWEKAKCLAEDVRYYGELILNEARSQLKDLFPSIQLPPEHGGGKANVLTWIWARTIKCNNPACGAITPLVKTFWLKNKKSSEEKAWIEPIVDKEQKKVSFKVRMGKGKAPNSPKHGRGVKFKCLVCNEIIDEAHIKNEGMAKRIGFKLMAIVAEGNGKKLYLSPDSEHEKVALQAKPSWFPDTELSTHPQYMAAPRYGMVFHGDLFTPRQLEALNVLSRLVQQMYDRVMSDANIAFRDRNYVDKPLSEGGNGPRAYADVITMFLSFAIDRLADFNCSLSTWKPSGEQQMHVFTRGALPMAWDFAEANIIGEKAICWKNAVEITADAIETIYVKANYIGIVDQIDASNLKQLKFEKLVISTDPPYYDNIPYADLSDFFYVWLRRNLVRIFPKEFSTLLVPKFQELVADAQRFGNKENAKEHFESGFKKTFSSLKEKLDSRFPMTVYYAFKQTDEDESDDGSDDANFSITTTGWETMLEALITTGFQITATWPVRASQKWRMRAMGANALASYIVLVCRPRSESAQIATRREFVNSLRRELPLALKNLQNGNIAPVDLAQAAIGPGMSVFSRYSKVLEADGTPMTVRTALQIINQELDAYLTAQEGEMDSDSRFCVAWYEQFGMNEAPFGEADVLARAKNTSVGRLEEKGVVYSAKGKVRLLKREELDEKWSPVSSLSSYMIWMCTQQLVKTLENEGEIKAAELVHKMRSDVVENAKSLVYRLYTIAERKGWTEEAYAYNALVVSWPDIQKKASELAARSYEQQSLF